MPKLWFREAEMCVSLAYALLILDFFFECKGEEKTQKELSGGASVWALWDKNVSGEW